jgi:hypothetical protein
MLEEIDYSEESKYDLFESVSDGRATDWISCCIANMAPSFEDIKKELDKKNIKINKKQYEKACKKLGLPKN